MKLAFVIEVAVPERQGFPMWSTLTLSLQFSCVDSWVALFHLVIQFGVKCSVLVGVAITGEASCLQQSSCQHDFLFWLLTLVELLLHMG